MKKMLMLMLTLTLTLTFAVCTAMAMTPGTYIGTADARGGMMTVEVTVTEDKIESIVVKEHADTIGICEPPIAMIPADIIAYQSLDVDTVAGATLTSYGVINAVTDALKQAGADIDALKAVEIVKPLPAAEDMQTQVVVAGGGMAGLVAAVTAADNGADVILVEKMSFLGGNLLLAGGGLGTVGAETVPEDDSLERVMAYFKEVNSTSSRQPDYDFIEAILPQTGIAIDYLSNHFGLEHTSSDRGDYVRTNFGQGADLTASLQRILEEQNVTILYDTKAEHIVMEDGAAIGLVVSNAGGEFTITADKVIIATGGASHDRERLLAANPELAVTAIYEEAAVSSTGDGFAMLKEISAKMGPGPFIKSAYPDFSPAFRQTFRNNPSDGSKLVVDAEGKRFANEAPYNQMYLTKNMLRHASPMYFTIYDEATAPEAFLAQMKEWAPSDNKNIVVHADTIEALAVKLDMDPATLKATYDAYQAACQSGVDTEFGKTAAKLVAYTGEGGYYAARLFPASWGTIGGALTDLQFHVLDANDVVIPNVFAVGECATSMLFGDYYFGGYSLGFYTAAGKIAAETAVAEINAK